MPAWSTTLDANHSVYASYTSIFKPQTYKDRNGKLRYQNQVQRPLRRSSQQISGMMPMQEAKTWIKRIMPGDTITVPAYAYISGADIVAGGGL